MFFKNKRLRLFIFTVLSFTFTTFAQTEASSKAKNSIYIDLLGTGGWYSLNYERLVFSHGKLDLGVSSGLSLNHFKDFERNLNPDFTLPFSLNAIYGTNHHVEAGIGTTLASVVRADEDYYAKRYFNINMSLTLGYRYQKPTGGFLFRAAYTPLIPVYRQTSKSDRFKSWISLSFGYTF